MEKQKFTTDNSIAIPKGSIRKGDKLLTKIIDRYGNERYDVVQINTMASMAVQDQAAECDINNIMKGNLAQFQGQQMIQFHESDFTVALQDDLTTAFNKVRDAQTAFNLLPSDLRLKMQNDPRKFENWVSDPSNKEEAIKYGFIQAPEPPPSTTVTPATPTT